MTRYTNGTRKEELEKLVNANKKLRNMTGVRLSQKHTVHTVAGGAGKVKAGGLDGLCAQSVIGAGRDQVLFLFQKLTQSLSCIHPTRLLFSNGPVPRGR